MKPINGYGVLRARKWKVAAYLRGLLVTLYVVTKLTFQTLDI